MLCRSPGATPDRLEASPMWRGVVPASPRACRGAIREVQRMSGLMRVPDARTLPALVGPNTNSAAAARESCRGSAHLSALQLPYTVPAVKSGLESGHGCWHLVGDVGAWAVRAAVCRERCRLRCSRATDRCGPQRARRHLARAPQATADGDRG